MTDTHEPKPQPEDCPKASVLDLAFSGVAAAFGVQSNKNRVRDFQQKSIVPFILTGVALTTFLLVSLILLVSWVLS